MARIIIISDGPTIPTGYGVAAYGLGKYLRRKGHDIAFLGLQQAGSPVYVQLDKENVPLFEGSNTQSMEKTFRLWKPQLGIHIRDAFAHTPKFFPQAYSLVALKDRPKIVLWTPIQCDGLPQEFVDACNTQEELTVTLTEWGKEQLLYQGVPFNHLEAIPLGFDPEIYHPREANKEKFGFPKDKPLIVSVGINDQHRKGWPLLVKAVGIVKKRMEIDLYLHTQPEGAFGIPYHGAHEGLKGQIGFPAGFSKTWGLAPEELADLLACADCYGNASIEEGQNVPAMEALAMGVPVAATDLPNHREILGDFGYYANSVKLYPTGWSFGWIADPQSLAEQIITALTDKKDRAPQVEYAKSKFAWPVVADRWEELFRKHTELGVAV